MRRALPLLLLVACAATSTAPRTVGSTEAREPLGLPPDCGPLRHLATNEDGSLLCLHHGYRFRVSYDGIERSETAAPVEDVASVEGGWVFTLADDSAAFATTPVGPLRSLGHFPRADGVWMTPLFPRRQSGAFLRVSEGRVFEADANGTREVAVPFVVRQALALGDQRLLLSPAGAVVYGPWSDLRPVPFLDAIIALHVDEHGPVLTTIPGDRRRPNGSLVPSSRRQRAPHHPLLLRLAELAHAARPFDQSVVRWGDGAVAAVVGGRLLVRLHDGRVRAHALSRSSLYGVLPGARRGWFLDGRRMMHVSDDGRVEAEWPRATLRDVRGWWGACDGSGEPEPAERPTEACVLDADGQPRVVRLYGEPFAQCGDRVYERTGDATLTHDLATGRVVASGRPAYGGVCGPGDALVFLGHRDGRAWVADAEGTFARETPLAAGAWLDGMSATGEMVVHDRDAVVHSLDGGHTWRRIGHTWRRIVRGGRIDCSAPGCYADTALGYVAVSSLPTAPSESPDTATETDWPGYEDGWENRIPFELACERHVSPPPRARVHLLASDRIQVREETGATWEAAVEGATFWRPFAPLAAEPGLIVVGTRCNRVFRLTPEGTVELHRPAPLDVPLCPPEERGVGSVWAVIEADGNVAVKWSNECLTVVGRFDAQGRLLARRRLATRGRLIGFAIRAGRAYLMPIEHWPPYELVPIDPHELPERADIPRLPQWNPRVCRDDEPAGLDFIALMFTPFGSARLRLDSEGDVCVLGSIGTDGFVARGGKLVRQVREGGTWFEERCVLRARDRSE